jgi:hypothetical protein
MTTPATAFEITPDMIFTTQYHDVCLYDMRASQEMRNHFHHVFLPQYLEGIVLPPPRDGPLRVGLPRKVRDCLCSETTCNIDAMSFKRQLDMLFKMGRLQDASDCIAYWKTCEANDDRNLIRSEPWALKMRVREMARIDDCHDNEEYTLAYRRTHTTGPIYFPDEVVRNTSIAIYQEGLAGAAINPQHPNVIATLEKWGPIAKKYMNESS